MFGTLRQRFAAVLGVLMAFALLWSSPSRAQDIVVGVNVVNPMRASIADQDAVFAQLKAAGVHVIRCAIEHHHGI